MRRFRRTLPVLLSVLAIAAVITTAVMLRKAAPPEPARLLPSADAFVYLNLQWARRTGALANLSPVEHASDYDAFIRETGIQVERDLEEVAVAVHYPAGTARMAGGKAQNSTRFTEIMVGRIDAVRLAAYLGKISSSVDASSGIDVFAIPLEDHTLRVAILGPEMVAVSNHDDPHVMAGIIQRSRKRASPFAGPSFLRAYYKRVPLASLAWAVVKIDPTQVAATSSGGIFDIPGGVLTVFPKPAVVVASARWIRAVHFRAEAFTESSDDARVITDKVGTFLDLFHAADITTAQGPDADVKAFFDSLQIKQDDKRAIMSATMPSGFLGKIFKDSPELSGVSPKPTPPAASSVKTPAAHKKPSH